MDEKQLYAEAVGMKESMSAMRRDIHMHPELGTKEFRTAQIVENFLKGIGVPTVRMCGTAVVGIIKGNREGGVVALRADMDALPMQDEKSNCPYRSQNSGVMHACGHDVHTTALLYAAKILVAHKNEIQGTVKLFFEPNEEGGGYAKKMVEEGVMENPGVDAVFALHQTTLAEVGNVLCHSGRVSSASGRFTIDVEGKSSHGAEPNRGIDAITIASYIVVALQQCVSRMSNPEDAVVLTIGKFTGGEVRNSLAKEVHMEGIHRTPTLEMRKKMNESIVRIAAGIGESMGANVRVNVNDGAAPTINDDEATRLVCRTAANMLGKDHVSALASLPITAAEDCGEFLSYSRGCYYNVGAANTKRGITAMAHTNNFDVDENCLPIAAAMHAAVAINFLNSEITEQ